MRLYRGLPSRADGPIALTIGNFDGVHRGHQAMLLRLCEAAEDLRLTPAVLTFDPHPREFFGRGAAPPRLTRLAQKLEVFRAFGVARTYVARFDAALAQLTADAFIDDVLVRRLDVRWVLVGNDFRFGKGRAGDLGVLRRHATTFSVEAMHTVLVNGERASSTAVRDALARGELDRAASLLGRHYTISGRVAHGEKRGRTLGFPTANLPLTRRPPVSGIFAVRVHGLGTAPRAGVASVGVRPTITDHGQPILEVYVFDFTESIYGRRVRVEFLHKLRDEEKYDDLDALSAQIRADVAQARAYFVTVDSPTVPLPTTAA
ncbi:MAG: bifunctional riboflavin kinase/FAD synthetase [Burkholderiales bacterium]|nr:bifunctional riboflavin kinase/FAD synthetase [Burkholderiales bacterium]